MNRVQENIEKVRERISAAAENSGRRPVDVRLVAVSKNFPAEAVRDAMAAGQHIFGENRVQEARDKTPLVPGDAVWHMIGRLQKNKAKYIPGLFEMVQSVDSYELAEALDRAMEKAIAGGNELKSDHLDILIQVNIAMEEQKGGIAEAAALDLVRSISGLPCLRIRGLMIIPPYSENPEETRVYYRKLRDIRDMIAAENIPNVEMKELSMGMSSDYQVAVEEGATLVRVGGAIFGERE